MEIAGATVDGVLKRPPYMSSVSGYRSSPCFSLSSRGPCSFIQPSSTPAPGAYDVPADERSRFRAPPKFSFGGSSRWTLGASPTKKQPGPGAYDPRDPVLQVCPKVGFGWGPRSSGLAAAQTNPGPGAYELRSSIGQGQMCTARGRYPSSFARSRSLPGPGAYNPSTSAVLNQSPKCGFGTSTRSDMGATARALVMPGPGAYDMQKVKAVGVDAPKFSATSRRRVNDLDSYVTPGPGSYNAHMTCFRSREDVRLLTSTK